MLISCVFISPSAAQTDSGALSHAASEAGSDVLEVQTMLKALGYDISSLDGQVGPETLNAIRAFQADNGFPVTGEFSRAGKALLEEFYQVSFASNTNSAREDSTVKDTKSSLQETATEQISNNLTHAFREVEKLGLAVFSLVYTNPSEASLLVTSGMSDNAKSLVDNHYILEKFLRSTIMFVGCHEQDTKIVSFLNIAKGNWLNFWIRELEVQDVYFSEAFGNDEYSEGANWYNVYDGRMSIGEAFRKSFNVQEQKFFEYYKGGRCLLRSKASLKQESQNIIETLASELELQRDIDAGILLQMEINNLEKHELSSADDLALSTIHTDTLSADLFAVYTLADYPRAILIQRWDFDDGRATVIDEGLIFLGLDE
jgi:hypothetical protein